MINLTHKIITQELLKLSANYPNPKSNDELQILSGIWLEDFNHISEEIFLKSIRLHRRHSKFFPTVADILECYQEIVRNIPKPIALEETRIELTPEEEIERNQLIADFRAKKGKIGASW